jgi:hypothetical protein
MGAMKNLTLGKEPDVIERSLMPLLEAKPTLRRAFTIDTPTGEVCISEVSGFDVIKLSVKGGNNRRSEVELDYEGFSELSRLLYVANLNRASSRPF